MTDHHHSGPEPPPAALLDELASAILDDAASGEELARAQEPEISRRVARFSALAEQVRSVPEPPAERREAAIAAALDAFTGAPAAGDDLSVRRARRAARADPARRLRLLGAAAAAVVAIAVGAVVVGGSADDDQTTATDALDERAEEGSAGSSLDATVSEQPSPAGDDSATAGGQEGAAQPSAAPADLGDFESADQLMDEAFSRATEAADGTDAGSLPSSAAARCPDLTGGATRIDTAELDGRAVLVFVRDGPAGTDEPAIVVVDATTCEVLASRGT